MEEFLSLKIALLTLSDSRDSTQDKSGDLLSERIIKAGHSLYARKLLTDEPAPMRAQISAWLKDSHIQVILTTGGTGITARDNTVEVMREFFDKEISGFGELFRMLSYQTIGTSAVQSRAIAGVAAKKLIFILPGSQGACKDAWDMILAYQLDSRHKPCNFAELLERL